MGLALQCCIGGFHVGFKVHKINPRAFHFSVANNKVGHFIYGLKDRVWPDFICHFHLFNGRFNRAPSPNSSWHADVVLAELTARHPLAIKSNLDFLISDSSVSASSMAELSKFALKPIDHMAFSNSHAHEASTISPQRSDIPIHFGSFLATYHLTPVIEESSSLSLMEKYTRQAHLEESGDIKFLRLGSFNCPINSPYRQAPQCFLKSAFKYAPVHSLWPPCLSAHYKIDWAQAGYSEEDIDLLAANWAVLCSRCLQWGHKKINCLARVICIHCSTPDHKARNCPARIPIDYYGPCMVVNPPTINLSKLPPAAAMHRKKPTAKSYVRCETCGYYGHVAKS